MTVRINTEVVVFGGEATHYLVLKIPLRDGKSPERHLKAPVVDSHGHVIDAVRDVVSKAERRAIDRAVNKIVGEDG